MLNFKYRVYPSNKQTKTIYTQFTLATELYNHLLEKAKEFYKLNGKTWTKFSMIKYITQLKKEQPKYKVIYSQVSQNICDRIAKAYQNYFARCKRKKKGEKNKVNTKD